MLTPTLKWALSVIWLAIVAVSLWFNFSQIDETSFQMAVTEGRTSWIKDQAYRQWVTDKGGIYAPPSEKYPPNPHLAHIPDRDVFTTDGKHLTLTNPAYMIRQVFEISIEPGAPKEHITSLRPLRPENKPDAWESEALRQFESGVEEVSALSEINGILNLRYMRPMITKEGCLKCHGHQGYKVGDIRGGVSFSIPFAPFQEAADAQKRSLLLWHALIGILGLTGLLASFQRISANERLLHQALNESRQANEKIMELNTTLERRVNDEVGKSRQKDLLLIQQSRLASMGEMIHNIAHQWRQPLNTLAVILANIQDDYRYNELTAESLESAVKKSDTILNQMSQTIDDFRNFFRSDNEAKEFDMADVIDEALVVIDASLSNNNIELVKEYQKPLPGYGFPNQLSQVFLNLLTNAKEAIKHKGIENGHISLKGSIENDTIRIDITDNGGGIDEEITSKIFDPYFTTKESGSGIGLYMARMIIERNHSGTITVSNTQEGARFTVIIPQHPLTTEEKELS